LDEEVPFYDDPEPRPLLHHCLQAIDRVLARFSERGLPLILAGDWNDGLSAVGLEGKGESIWLAHFLYYMLIEIQPLLEHKRLLEKADYYCRGAEELKKAINEIGWDGNWFWRASKDSGELIGSHQNTEGKIFLNAQTWAVIAGSTDKERQQKVIAAVETLLESEAGPLLLHPAYSTPDPYIGYLSRYAPGVRENGGVYTHAAIWAIWAECLLKRRQAAYRLYRKINPIYNGLNPERYVAEPYVTSGSIEGPASPHYGRGGWTWYTGSAAWLFQITLDYLLGIRADYQGLIIDPCLPEGWHEVKINRLFRGTNYSIQITSSGTPEATITEILVDGKKIEGNLIPHIPDRSEVEVKVKLG
ncbi:MAG: glycosyl transferase family 36, partial [candidate division KSB1 bacterium]|nr:glycosyl transferase family 36 [candidate division KSB1 bacterium]